MGHIKFLLKLIERKSDLHRYDLSVVSVTMPSLCNLIKRVPKTRFIERRQKKYPVTLKKKLLGIHITMAVF